MAELFIRNGNFSGPEVVPVAAEHEYGFTRMNQPAINSYMAITSLWQ